MNASTSLAISDDIFWKRKLALKIKTNINKFNEATIISCLYYNGKNKFYFIKRFKIETSVKNKRYKFISLERGSKLIAVSTCLNPKLCFNYRLLSGNKKSKNLVINDFVAIKGWKSIGNKINGYKQLSGFQIIEKEPADYVKIKNNPDSSKEENNQQKLTLF